MQITNRFNSNEKGYTNTNNNCLDNLVSGRGSINDKIMSLTRKDTMYSS